MKQTQKRVLGRLLAEARKQKQLSLRDVQEATGIPFTWIARTEQGHYTRPAPERLTRLAELLGVDARVMDEATSGEMAGQLPQPRTYFRAKYNLSASEIARLEEVLAQVRRERAAARKSQE